MNSVALSTMAFLGGSMSGGEILLILVAMLLLFGSKKLPGMARNLGKSMEAFRRASREVTNEIMTSDLDEPVSQTSKKREASAVLDAGAGDSGPAIKTPEQSVGRDESSRT